MLRLLAVVTGASSGIGFELARVAAAEGYDLVVAADTRSIHDAAGRLADLATDVVAVEADLSTKVGVDTLLEAIADRPVDVLCANAGIALGHAFLDQPPAAWQQIIDTNITGTLYLLHRAMPAMIARGGGKVLVTGSINGSIPGPFLAVYNATKAFLNNFTDALREELRDAPVTLTTLMPGPVETPVYTRADMLDTVIGSLPKPGAAKVARAGWDAMIAGEPRIIPGFLNRIVEAAAHVTPSGIVAAVHRVVAEPR